MKKYSVSLLLEAVDKVTGPIGRMVDKAQRGAAEIANAVERSNAKQAHSAKKHAHAQGHAHGKAHAHGIKHGLMENLGEASNFIPEAIVAGASLEALVEGYKKVTEVSDLAALSTTRLNTMMMHVKGTTHEDVKAVEEYADKLEDLTAIDHKFLDQGASTLATFGLRGAEIRKMLPALADLQASQEGANTTAEGSITAGKVIGKLLNGQTGALRRLGIFTTAAEDKILKHGKAAQRLAVAYQVIEKRYGGYAAALLKNDPELKKKLALEQLETAEQRVGDALKPLRERFFEAFEHAMPMIEKLAGKFADSIPAMLAWGDELQKDLAPGIQAFAKNFESAFGETSPIGKLDFSKSLKNGKPDLEAIHKATKEFADDVNPRLGNLGTNLGKIAGGVRDLMDDANRLVDKNGGWMKFYETLEKINGWVSPFQAIAAIQKSVGELWDGASGTLSKAGQNLQDYFDGKSDGWGKSRRRNGDVSTDVPRSWNGPIRPATGDIKPYSPFNLGDVHVEPLPQKASKPSQKLPNPILEKILHPVGMNDSNERSIDHGTLTIQLPNAPQGTVAKMDKASKGLKLNLGVRGSYT